MISAGNNLTAILQSGSANLSLCSLHCNPSTSLNLARIFVAAKEHKGRKKENQKSLRSMCSFVATPSGCGLAALFSLAAHFGFGFKAA
jgi:hypothetical protein